MEGSTHEGTHQRVMYKPARFVVNDRAAQWIKDAESGRTVYIVGPTTDEATRQLTTDSGTISLQVFPRFGPRHILLAAPADMDSDTASRHIHGTPLTAPPPGENTSWLDAILVAMRFTGIGRFAGDMLLSNEARDNRLPAGRLATHIVNYDWPLEDSPAALRVLGEKRDELLSVTHPWHLHPDGSVSVFREFNDIVHGLPSLCFNVGLRSRCKECGDDRLLDKCSDRMVGLSFLENHDNLSHVELQDLVDDSFGWAQGESFCDTCESRLYYRWVIIDRLPHILKLDIPFDNSFTGPMHGLDPLSFCKELLISYGTAVGTELEARYKPIAFFHTQDGQVSLTFICDTTRGDGTCIFFDGAGSMSENLSLDVLEARLNRLGIVSALYSRVYTGITGNEDEMLFQADMVV